MSPRANLLITSLIILPLAGHLLAQIPATEPGSCASWNMREGQGNSLLDGSGHGNNGRISGARWIQSDAGPALQFSPQAKSCVKVANSESLNLTEAFSIELDVKTYGKTGHWQGILSKRSESNSDEKCQYGLAISPDLQLTFYASASDFWLPETGIHLNTNQWYHINARYDGFLRQVELYVDGRLAKTLQNAPVVRPSANPVWLGTTSYGDEYLNGELRQVRITDLVAQRIGQLEKQGINHAVILKSVYLAHEFKAADGRGLRGTAEVMALNPAGQSKALTLCVKVGDQTARESGEISAASRGVLRCVIPESLTNTRAGLELVEGGKVVATDALSVAGSEPVLGFQAYVVSHTHSDFAWHNSIKGCLDENVAAVAKSVEMAEQYPDFRFCMEHMLAVREYLRRNPDKTETVRKLMREGRFEAGGFFTGPWELTSGSEGLVRQLYLGKRWVKQTLGVDPLTVWNVDVAGHTAQMPQILSKAGIKGLVISAGSSGPYLLDWLGRDGSSVLVWRTPWGYGASAPLGMRQQNIQQMTSAMPWFMDDICRNAAEFGLPRVGFIADGTDCQSPDESLVRNIRQWNSENRYPPITYSSTAGAFAAVEKDRIVSAAGEMPSPWDFVQSQGNDCFMVDRHLAGRVLAAEKFAAFGTLVSPGYAYPKESFDEIWWNRLYVYDHNWGGWSGEESDRAKTEMIQTAAHITDGVLDKALESIAGAIKFKKPAPQAIPLVVFNPLSWERQDIVSCDIPAGADKSAFLSVTDSRGRPVACQVSPGKADASSVQVSFCAQVPSLGYATYYASWSKQPPKAGSAFKVDEAGQSFENRFYRLKLDPATGAIKSLLDKQSGRELVRAGSKFGFNELVALEDTDVDIGMHLTGKQWLSREHPSTIKVLENGPVRLVIEVAGQLMDASRRVQQIVLYTELPKVDLVTKLDWEGKPNVQLYQEFPLNVPEPRVRYAVPYGWEEYGSEMKYAEPWFSHDSPPVAKYNWRGVRGWVELANGQNSVSLASDCNVAAFKDVSAQPQPGYLIQPLLLRTVRSCGGNHFNYLQKGAHEFHFALQAQADSARLGEELDSPLLACVAKTVPSASASLPERLSFLRVSPPNVHVAVVKQAEDGKGLVLRLVEMKQRTRTTEAVLRPFRPIRSAMRTSIIEENQPSGALRSGASTAISLAPAGIETLRVGF